MDLCMFALWVPGPRLGLACRCRRPAHVFREWRVCALRDTFLAHSGFICGSSAPIACDWYQRRPVSASTPFFRRPSLPPSSNIRSAILPTRATLTLA